MLFRSVRCRIWFGRGRPEEQHPQQLWNYNEENALSDQKYWDNWASFHTHICSTSHLGTIHCHWGYASSLAGNDFWGESMHLCNGVDETGCNGPDGHVWGAVKKYVEYPTMKHHSTRECHRMAATGEYPEDCAYRSYDPRTGRDYAGRVR